MQRIEGGYVWLSNDSAKLSSKTDPTLMFNAVQIIIFLICTVSYIVT